MTGATLPFNKIVLPSAQAATYAVTDAAARSIPGVAKALGIYTGMIQQAPLDDYRGVDPLPRPRILEQPDPEVSCSWFVGQQVADYLLHGNAVALVTARDASGYPAALRWVPACWVDIEWDWVITVRPRYWIRGVEVPASELVHVRRGADDWNPWRGVGIIEAHMRTLARAVLEEDYEYSTLADSAVPSVAVIAPNPRLSTEQADEAKARWVELFGQPGTRQPGVFPAGTQIQALGWSPSDAELIAARQLSNIDLANLFNLDPYWLGAESSSLTYRSPGPMFTNLVRVSLGPVMTQLEQAWSAALLPRGRTCRFDRNAIQRDDLSAMVPTLVQAIGANLMSVDEARVLIGLPRLEAPNVSITSPVATVAEDDTAAQEETEDGETE